MRRLLAFACLAVVACSGDGNGSGPFGSNSSLPRDYIRGDKAGKLVFELDLVDGTSARTEARDHVSTTLAELIDKPDGIEWTTDGTIEARGSDYVWTFDELQDLADDNFDLEVDGDTVKIHVMYVDGRYEDENVLGVAWANRHLVMFHDVLNDSCTRPLLMDRLCGPAESSVLLHEVGHVIGLVDNGVEMVEPHKDEEHGAHDESEDCVMYFAYDGVQVFDILENRLTGASSELEFDDACKADLAAARGE